MAFVAVVVLAVLVLSMAELLAPDLATLGGALVLAAAGKLTPAEAMAGFSNESVTTVAALLVVVAALDRAGVVDRIPLTREAHAKGPLRTSILTLSVPVILVSAMVANTPLVALLLPLFRQLDQAREGNARSLLPLLSYAAVMGGVLALPGTSTNMLVSGMLGKAGRQPLGFFELTAAAGAAALAGLGVLLLLGPALLPRPGSARVRPDQPGIERYLFELAVLAGGPVAGQTVESGGLRALEAGFLAHLRRGTQVLGPVAHDQTLEPGDVLVFAGPPALHDRLAARPGLARVAPGGHGPAPDLPLFEAVVAHGGSLAGRSLQEAAFRERHQAVVLGIDRQGEPMGGPLGRTPLAGGDLLLIEGPETFLRPARESGDFYLVAPCGQARPGPPRPVGPALGLFAAMLAVVALGGAPLELAAPATALAVVATRLLDARDARRALDLSLLVMLAGSIALGRAVETSGLAAALAKSLAGPAASLGPWGTLAGIYLTTLVLTEFASNAAAAAIMFPVALSTAAQQHLPERPLVLAVTLAASLAFANPFGYQTHLMVMAAGGLRARDLVPLGLALDLATMAAALLVLGSRLGGP